MSIQREILNKIKEYNTIIIHGHIRPDGDCYGSQFGLKDIIKNSFPNKDVYVVGETSNYVSFIGEPDNISDEKFNGALSICVDCAIADRLADQRFKLADFIIKIDHHIPVEDYGNINWVIDKKPACAQMIYEFYDEFKDELTLTKQGAEAIYTGILTDTGRFKYDSIEPKTFITAAKLLEFGVDISYIDNMLSLESLSVLKFKGYVLSHFKMTKAGFAYIKITNDIVEKYNITTEEAANQVNLLSTIPDYPVWALIIEYPGEIRIRLRSKGPDVDKLANAYNGGGHAKASGAKLDNWEQLKTFIKDANKLVTKYKNNMNSK